jgi:hypothetical protein
MTKYNISEKKKYVSINSNENVNVMFSNGKYQHLKQEDTLFNLQREEFWGNSSIEVISFNIENKKDKTFLVLKQENTRNYKRFEIDNNYFLFPQEIFMNLTVRDEDNIAFTFPSTISIFPSSIETKKVNWYDIGDGSNFITLKLGTNEIYFETDQSLIVMNTMFAVSSTFTNNNSFYLYKRDHPFKIIFWTYFLEEKKICI